MERRERRRVVDVYVGYHEDRFPEIPADKHREHVVRIRARVLLHILYVVLSKTTVQREKKFFACFFVCFIVLSQSSNIESDKKTY